MMPNQVGAVSEAAIELDLLKQGFNVLYPTVPTRYDRLVEIGEQQFVRVQIKSAYVDRRDGNLRVAYSVPYNDDQVDCIAVYDKEGERIFYIPITDLPRDAKGFTLRITERRYKRIKTVGLQAENYTTFPYGGQK